MPQQPRRFQSFMRFRTRELLQSWRSPSDFKSRIRPDLVFRQIVAYERANISRTEGVGPGKTVESGSELCLCRHLPRTLDPVRSPLFLTVDGLRCCFDCSPLQNAAPRRFRFPKVSSLMRGRKGWVYEPSGTTVLELPTLRPGLASPIR